ncbi:MAG: hypothetical protein QOJ50_824 [Cryptosporangiaceae bacterium]|nr:hypothetical protein [Cryptosporangiaceae bacterium]
MVAAAIRARAHLIVTSNLTDFPASSLQQFDIEAISPDDFLTAQMDLDRGVLWRILQQISDTYQNPPVSVGDLVGRLRAHGLIRTAAALERA